MRLRSFVRRIRGRGLCDPTSLTGTTHEHTPKADAVGANIGTVATAVERQQSDGNAAVPTRTAQHTERAGWAVLVLAPFIHVAAHVVEAQFIGRKAARR